LYKVLVRVEAGGRSSVKVQPKQILIYLGIALIALTVWNDPSRAGNRTGEFLSDTTDWAQDVFDKFNEFAEGVTD
jgi:hypothetical protein